MNCVIRVEQVGNGDEGTCIISCEKYDESELAGVGYKHCSPSKNGESIGIYATKELSAFDIVSVELPRVTMTTMEGTGLLGALVMATDTTLACVSREYMNIVTKIDTLYPRKKEDIKIEDWNYIKDTYGKFYGTEEEKQEEFCLRYFKLNRNVFSHRGKIELYSLNSFFNHSCEPNCIMAKKDGAQVIMAARSIKKGSELTISYIEDIENTKYLNALLGMPCRCKKCAP